MDKVAIFLPIVAGVFIAFAASLLPLILSGGAAEEKARERRLADARMNARLLKLNL